MLFKDIWAAYKETLAPLVDFHYLLVSACLTGLVILTIPLEIWVKPFAQQFRIDNKYINYPMMPEHVPVSLLALLSLILPLGFIFTAGIVDKRTRRTCAISILGLLFAIAATMFFTDILKILIGNQRPDFIARCQPRPDAPTSQYVSVLDVCTTDNMSVLWEGCKSTPSGHSALSFAGLGFLSFWFVRTFELQRPDRPLYLRLSGYAPLLISTYVAYSRIIDHKHHWIDVISGSIIGAFIAYMSLKHATRLPEPIERSHSYSGIA